MRVAIESLNQKSHLQAVSSALQFIKWESIIASQTRIYIKLNLTYPRHEPGVTVSPVVVEALIQLLTTRTANVTLVESDGGGLAWKAEEAFNGHGLYEIAKRYDIRLMNLSEQSSEVAETTIAGRQVKVVLPSILLHDCDVFITVPVPKVHLMTRVSLAFKNQWGCLPDPKRIRNHPEFKYKILAINKLLRTRIAVFDGTYFLNRVGPVGGDAIRKDLVIAADDIGAGSLICCKIMGIDPNCVDHLKLARKEGMFPDSISEVELNRPVEQFIAERFYVHRTFLNRLALAAFKSRFGTRLVYDSVFAHPIHELLYLFRGRPEVRGYYQ